MSKFRIILTIFVFYFSIAAMAKQTYSVSLLTCGAGTEPYQLFGHTAIKVVYHGNVSDTIIYNYGTFLFDETFMKKFIRGRLYYYLATENTDQFLSTYQDENRWVTERPLLLDSAQSASLVKALEWNAKEENKYYLYDFMSNNCCTKPRDLLEKLGVTWNRKTMSDYTYRKAVDQYVPNEWMDLGIDLLLGSKVDKAIGNRELMFLPDYLDENLRLARINGEPLNTEVFTLYQNTPVKSKWMPSPTAFLWFGLLVLLAIQISGKHKKLLSIKANSLLLFSGILGWLLVFMWLFTDHPYVKSNFNLLWAFPLHFPLALYLFQSKNKKFVRYYLNFSLILIAICLVIWVCKVQIFHNAVLPYILLLIWSLQHHREG
jgi:hypothetical protein